MKAYKICEFENGVYKTLFHGINGSRSIPVNTWLASEQKIVKDGTSKTTYESGWHVLPTYEDAVNYLTKFKSRLDKLVIVEIDVPVAVGDTILVKITDADIMHLKGVYKKT